MNQPITVHPRNRFTRMIPAASRLSRPMIVGRKYSRVKQSRVSKVHPFRHSLGAADTPARLYWLIRRHPQECFHTRELRPTMKPKRSLREGFAHSAM